MTALAMILGSAERHADRIAIEDADGRAVTYRALVAEATTFARTVRGPVVELAAGRSATFVARCLGCWLAGAAWLPIDPTEPVARARALRERVASVRDPDRALAYVIGTSGSSGRPKAVLVGHRGVPALLHAQIDAFQLAPGARSLWLHAPTFDASVSDWGTALAAGATLVIPAPGVTLRRGGLAAELARRAITHVDLPPVLLPELALPPPALRVVVLGGEPCPIDRVRALARRLRVVVVYGPTEATVCSSLVVVDPERWRRPLIGAPLPGVRYQLDGDELWIGGDGVALGYAGDADETARCFVERDGTRWYRTGDRVEATDAGLAFVGRVDRQVKLAGRRVELDEIEAVVRGMPGVRDAAIAIAGSRLVAYIEGDVVADDVRASLRAQLPRWMVPARVVVGALPRTASGKLDRAALVRPASEPTDDDPLVRELAVLWTQVLGADRATRFRDAGGDSLAAIELHAALAATGHTVDDGFFAGDPSFDELVAQVRAAGEPPVVTAGACEQRGLAAATSLPPRSRGEAVLITGATGLLGRALVQAWRARDPRRIVALVRAPDEATARRRLGIDGIDVVLGDLACLPELPAYAAIVHAGATIDLAGDWARHAAVNIDGTARLAALAAATGAAFHHVSTLSVVAATDRTGRHEPSTSPDPGARVFGGYAQTKLAAEAIARRLPRATVLRLGLLTGPEARDGQLAMTIRALAKLGCAPPDAPLAFDVTPVDHAAEAIAALALDAEPIPGTVTHHIAAAQPVTWSVLVAAIAERHVLERVDATTWATRARARLGDPDIAMAILALHRLHATPSARLAPFDLFLATDRDFATEPTRARLAALGVRAPDPATALAALVDGALAEVA
ncbi:MAG TPA: AMP-binding protein [Kofleriaceae bacterium]|nr:AMP-binding protein [Kofleriaceae bacterium]